MTDNNNNNDFNGYSLFNDVMNVSIQTWNRVNTVFNIRERHGNAVAERYLKHFSKSDLFAIYTMMALIKEEGYSTIRREIFKGEYNAAA